MTNESGVGLGAGLLDIYRTIIQNLTVNTDIT